MVFRALRKRTHLSPTTVIATLALVFAMTGGAYAAKKYLITSTKQISPSVLKSLQGKAGPAGAAGPGGPQGPAGAAGAKGENGTAGSNGKNGEPGQKGEQGPQGATGNTGANGKSVTVSGTASGCAEGGVTVEEESSANRTKSATARTAAAAAARSNRARASMGNSRRRPTKKRVSRRCRSRSPRLCRPRLRRISSARKKDWANPRSQPTKRSLLTTAQAHIKIRSPKKAISARLLQSWNRPYMAKKVENSTFMYPKSPAPTHWVRATPTTKPVAWVSLYS